MAAWIPCEVCEQYAVRVDPAAPPPAVLCGRCRVVLRPTNEEELAYELLAAWCRGRGDTPRTACRAMVTWLLCEHWEGVFTRGFLHRVAHRWCSGCHEAEDMSDEIPF
jgi:hypothetical protein